MPRAYHVMRHQRTGTAAVGTARCATCGFDQALTTLPDPWQPGPRNLALACPECDSAEIDGLEPRKPAYDVRAFMIGEGWYARATCTADFLPINSLGRYDFTVEIRQGPTVERTFQVLSGYVGRERAPWIAAIKDALVEGLSDRTFDQTLLPALFTDPDGVIRDFHVRPIRVADLP